MLKNPFAPKRQSEQQARPTWPVVALFAAFWIVLCAFAFALMMGWLQT